MARRGGSGRGRVPVAPEYRSRRSRLVARRREQPGRHPRLEVIVVHELLERLGGVLDHAGEDPGQHLVVLDASVGVVGVSPRVPENGVRGDFGREPLGDVCQG